MEICEKHGLSFDSDFYSECIECENEEAELDEIQEDTTSLEEKIEKLQGLTEDEAMEREHDKEVDDFRDAEDRNLSDLANR